jgi:hypothetical protein
MDIGLNTVKDKKKRIKKRQIYTYTTKLHFVNKFKWKHFGKGFELNKYIVNKIFKKRAQYSKKLAL